MPIFALKYSKDDITGSTRIPEGEFSPDGSMKLPLEESITTHCARLEFLD
jgi:hypothetical protein